MVVALIALIWVLTMFGALTAGFHWSKRVPSDRTLCDVVTRRLFLLAMYARATLAVLSPAYRRRWDSQRAEALQAYRDNLQPIERAEWWHARQKQDSA